MHFRLLADLVVLLHFAFVLFALFGGILCVWRKWVARVHIPLVLWAVIIEFTGWICPLTPLEIRFRTAAGETGYSGGFVDHYILPVLYPAGLTRTIQIILGLIVIVLNFFVYRYVFFGLSKPGKE